jgi:hypothetical protein
MPQDDYERYRKRLEEQLHSDIGLLYDAFHAKLRAYETVLRSRRGDLDLDPGLSPPDLSPAPVPAPVPAPPTPQPRNEPDSVIDALREALPRLPEEFDKFDLLQALDFEPRRSTFYEALKQLQREGAIDLVRGAGGKRAAVYRKVDGAL